MNQQRMTPDQRSEKISERMTRASRMRLYLDVLNIHDKSVQQIEKENLRCKKLYYHPHNPKMIPMDLMGGAPSRSSKSNISIDISRSIISLPSADKNKKNKNRFRTSGVIYLTEAPENQSISTQTNRTVRTRKYMSITKKTPRR